MKAVRWICGACLTVAAFGPTAASASAADQIYWGNAGGESISHANLAGGGGAEIPITGVTVDHPEGLAIDSAAGRIYWANRDGAEYSIRFANLDGSGGGVLNTAPAPVAEPHGLAIDPALGRIYWANFTDPSIFFANLDGSGGGKLDTTGGLVEQPLGLAVHPAQNRIYWANFDGGEDDVDFANLDGSGGGRSLDLTGGTVDMPRGVAVDASTNRVYWPNTGDSGIGFASANGGEGGSVFTDGLPLDSPNGIAIDPIAKRVYWGAPTANSIAFASLTDGGTVGLLDTTGATRDDPEYPVLLQEPRNTAPPTVGLAQIPRTAERHIPERHAEVLDCSPGQWAPDELESFLYRAPQSIAFQWLRNGQPLAGETAGRIAAGLVGSYSCVVTATNGAGSTSVTSTGSFPIVAGLRLGKVRLNRKKGTATIVIGASGAGTLLISGKSLAMKRRELSAPSFGATLVVKPKGKSKTRLRAKGKLKLKLRATYTPTDGQPLVRTRSITLRLAAR